MVASPSSSMRVCVRNGLSTIVIPNLFEGPTAVATAMHFHVLIGNELPLRRTVRRGQILTTRDAWPVNTKCCLYVPCTYQDMYVV